MALAMAAPVPDQAVVECSIFLPQVTYTLMNPVVSTYCPTCDSAKSAGLPYTTIYETVYINVYPTGLRHETFTITNECTGTTPIDPGTVPPGFTTTAVVCKACLGSPSIVVTTPVARLITSDSTILPGQPFSPQNTQSTVSIEIDPQIGTATITNSAALTTSAASNPSTNPIDSTAPGSPSGIAAQILAILSGLIFHPAPTDSSNNPQVQNIDPTIPAAESSTDLQTNLQAQTADPALATGTDLSNSPATSTLSITTIITIPRPTTSDDASGSSPSSAQDPGSAASLGAAGSQSFTANVPKVQAAASGSSSSATSSAITSTGSANVLSIRKMIFLVAPFLCLIPAMI